MAGVMGGMMLLGWTSEYSPLYAGRCVQKRRNKTLIYIMAALSCMFIPDGTLLGVFTFIVLASPAAIQEFSEVRQLA